MAMALAASLISIRIAIPVALVEIVVGAVAAVFRLPRRERAYTTLLMATGLTFGSIAALFGLTHGLISERQYTELVTVVLLSAFVPTLIAQLFVRPKVIDVDEEEALGAEDVSVIHHRVSPASQGDGAGAASP